MNKKNIRVVAAVTKQDGCYLITQRRQTAVMPSHWEFPGGKVEPGEQDEIALKRELKERLGADFQIEQKLAEKTHIYKDYDITLVLYSASLAPAQTLQAKRVQDFKWVAVSELGFYQFPDPDQQALDLLELDS